MTRITGTYYLDLYPSNDNKTAWKTITENGLWKEFEAIRWIPEKKR